MIAWLFACTVAFAQPDPRVEARERFDRGLGLFDEGRYDAALAEFQRAYELSPSYRILYNLGRVYAETRDSVRAVDALERFLSEGGASIERRRRAEVDALLAEQRARVSRVWVRTNVPDAQISIDGALALAADGTPLRTPLREPIRVTAGRRLIGARATGHEAAERALELPGGVEETLALELLPLASEHAVVRIESSLRAVRIVVDGLDAGVTPLEDGIRLPPGRHTIEARRTGYTTERRDVVVEPRSDTSVRFDLALDPSPQPSELGRVELRIPRASHSLSLDGRTVVGRSFEAPVGEHVVVLEVADRETVRTIVNVPSEGIVELEPELEWTATARDQRIASAGVLRTLGWIGIATGAALFFGLGPVVVYGLEQISDADTEIARLDHLNDTCGSNPRPECFPPGTMTQYDWPALALAEDAHRTNWIVGSATAGWIAVAGAALVGTGIALLVVAPSDEEIDASARFEVTLGSGSLSLTGAF